MDETRWATLIDILRPHIKALRITGGEPTLHPQFHRIIQLLEGVSVPFVLFTNGRWTDPARTIELLRRCTHLKGILVSLHGADEESFRAYTGVNGFECVLENVGNASAAGLHVATNTLLLTTTAKRISEIVTLALSSGASTVSFGRFYGPPIDGLSLSPADVRAALVEIAQLRQQDERIVVSNCVPSCFLPDADFGDRGCTSGFTHCTIGPEGEVRPCTHTPITLGTVWEDDIQTLWQSPQLRAWRRQIPTGCLSCAALNQCRGGCRATAQQLGLAQDPLMCKPLQQVRDRAPVELLAKERARLTCAVQATDYGYGLHGSGHYVTLSARSQPILLALEGQATVEQIHEQFGLAGLQLVACLAEKRMVELI
jgi:radical SAM protein with 4Fe4S-binding SPASM domain